MIDRSDPQWYRDAIVYQLHVKSFFDSNDDGMGDFEGVTRKLDYIKDLGATAIWVMPFYPSPLRDDGYDIADYRNINPSYGTMRDFRRFVREAPADAEIDPRPPLRSVKAPEVVAFLGRDHFERQLVVVP